MRKSMRFQVRNENGACGIFVGGIFDAGTQWVSRTSGTRSKCHGKSGSDLIQLSFLYSNTYTTLAHHADTKKTEGHKKLVKCFLYEIEKILRNDP